MVLPDSRICVLCPLFLGFRSGEIHLESSLGGQTGQLGSIIVHRFLFFCFFFDLLLSEQKDFYEFSSKEEKEEGCFLLSFEMLQHSRIENFKVEFLNRLKIRAMFLI